MERFGVTLHPDTPSLVENGEALSSSFGGNGEYRKQRSVPILRSTRHRGTGIQAIFANRLVVLCTITACIGGLLFGFDQGLVSIVLVMPKFLETFPQTDATVTSSAGLNQG